MWVTWNAAKGDAEAGHVPDVHRGLWRIGCAVVFVSTIAPSVRCGDLQEGGGAGYGGGGGQVLVASRLHRRHCRVKFDVLGLMHL